MVQRVATDRLANAADHVNVAEINSVEELDEPHTEGQLRVRRSNPRWSGTRTRTCTRTSTSHGAPRRLGTTATSAR